MSEKIKNYRKCPALPGSSASPAVLGRPPCVVAWTQPGDRHRLIDCLSRVDSDKDWELDLDSDGPAALSACLTGEASEMQATSVSISARSAFRGDSSCEPGGYCIAESKVQRCYYRGSQQDKTAILGEILPIFSSFSTYFLPMVPQPPPFYPHVYGIHLFPPIFCLKWYPILVIN